MRRKLTVWMLSSLLAVVGGLPVLSGSAFADFEGETDAEVAQDGDNSGESTQEGQVSSGDASSGSQTTGVVSNGGSTSVQADNTSDGS